MIGPERQYHSKVTIGYLVFISKEPDWGDFHPSFCKKYGVGIKNINFEMYLSLL